MRHNTIVGAFVTEAPQDLMLTQFLSKLSPDQLLCTEPTSDILGELKGEYSELLMITRFGIYKNL